MHKPSSRSTLIEASLDRCIASHVPSGRRCVVSVTGSGGKTTTIERLARYWADQGYRVLVSTTTRMALPSRHRYPFEHLCLLEEGEQRIVQAHAASVTLYGRNVQGKLGAPEEHLLERSMKDFDRVLLEADGARSLPLKIHNERDPVMSDATDVVVALMGLGALDTVLDDSVMYLSKRFRDMVGYTGERVNEDVYRMLLEHPEGVFKRCNSLPVVVCCNQSDLVGADRSRQVIRAMRERWDGRPFDLLCCSWLYDTIDCQEYVEPWSSDKGESGEFV